MLLNAVLILAAVAGMLWLGRAIRNFDRKMVAAGERRRLAAEAAAGSYAPEQSVPPP